MNTKQILTTADPNIDKQGDAQDESPAKSIIKLNKLDSQPEQKRKVLFSPEVPSYTEKEDTASSPSILKKKRANYGSNENLNSSYQFPTNAVTTNFAVGKVEDGMAQLISEDLYTIEVPTTMLPPDVRKGNILRFTIERDIDAEEQRRDNIQDIQKSILTNPQIFNGYKKKIEELRKKEVGLIGAQQADVSEALHNVAKAQENAPSQSVADNDVIKIKPAQVSSALKKK